MAARRMNPQQMGMGQPPQMRNQHPGGQGPRGMPQPGMPMQNPQNQMLGDVHLEENLGDGQHGQMVSNK